MLTINNSKRLKYELITKNDAQFLYELDQDPLVMKYINGGISSSMEAIKNVFIPRFESYTNLENGWGLWKVTVSQTNALIGWILIRPMDFFSPTPKFNNLEMGWRFMKKSWGKGYATEAAKHIMHSLIEQMEIYQFSAIAVPDNKASINVMKSIGMTYLKSYLHKDPLFEEDVVCYHLKVKP